MNIFEVTIYLPCYAEYIKVIKDRYGSQENTFKLLKEKSAKMEPSVRGKFISLK